MPTLIRLLVALLFLGGLGFAGLFALTIFVNPGQKLVTVRIPARELVLTPVLPAKEAPVAEVAPPPQTDDPKARVVNTPE
jgi:hypothetical protein